jgi:2-polyprenyl-6-methoxyphenol hydroxylase-like FAD-dependent oxidoreductase
VIVGGGPGGLAAALVLSNVKLPNNKESNNNNIKSNNNKEKNNNNNNVFLFQRIVVLDEALQESYDPTRAYFFNINRRGQTFTDAFDIDLSARGTPIREFARLDVPSNIEDVFDETTTPFSRPMTDEARDNMGTMYWIPRHEMVELIQDKILSKNKETTLTTTTIKKKKNHDDDDDDGSNNNNNSAIIEFRRGVRCEYIEPTEDGMVKIVVTTGTTKTNGNNETDDTKDNTIEENFIVADLCVGADGISSNVRRSLEDGRFDTNQWSWSSSNARHISRNFGLKQYTSPSTGLRIKGLRVDPGFAIPIGGSKRKNNDNDMCNDENKSNGTTPTTPTTATKTTKTKTIPIDNKYTYFLKSATNGPTDSLPLSILPQKDPFSIASRPVNICTEPNHDIWNPTKIRTDDGGASAKAFFAKAHPRYDWDDLVTTHEWELFASTTGSRFPPCQYVPSMYVSSSTTSSTTTKTSTITNHNKNKSSGTTTTTTTHSSASYWGTGVVLLGDALHAFPPDLGQGVNAAFCDSMALGKSFEEAAAAVAATTTKSTTTTTTTTEEVDPKTDSTKIATTIAAAAMTTTTTTSETEEESFVSRALKSYQTTHGPETRALIQLARCGAPFQYGQSSRWNMFRKKLWTANLALRLLLNKVTFGWSPKPAILIMMVRMLVIN